MTETSADRIERALARIEAAAGARIQAAERLSGRHALLRDRIQDAVTSLDALIARENSETSERDDG